MAAFTGPSKLRSIKGEKNGIVTFASQLSREAQLTQRSSNLICEFLCLLKHKRYREFMHVARFPHCGSARIYLNVERDSVGMLVGKSTVSCRPQKPLQMVSLPKL